MNFLYLRLLKERLRTMIKRYQHTQRIFFLLLIIFSFAEKSFSQTDTVHFSKLFNASRPYRIYIPADYYASQKRYPVIYFFHGNQGNEKLYFDSLQQLVNDASVIL